jgi:hypothetical protein
MMIRLLFGPGTDLKVVELIRLTLDLPWPQTDKVASKKNKLKTYLFTTAKLVFCRGY